MLVSGIGFMGINIKVWEEWSHIIYLNFLNYLQFGLGASLHFRFDLEEPSTLGSCIAEITDYIEISQWHQESSCGQYLLFLQMFAFGTKQTFTNDYFRPKAVILLA